MKREGWIDSCRFFAIFVIIATHFLADLLPEALLLWETMPGWLLLGGLTGKFSVAFFFVLLGYFASSPRHFTAADYASYTLRRYLQFSFFVLVTETVYIFGCRVVSVLFHAPDAAVARVLSDGWHDNLIFLLRDSFLFEDTYNSPLWCLQQLFLASLLCRLTGYISETLSTAFRVAVILLTGAVLLLLSPVYCVWITVALLGVLLRYALSVMDSRFLKRPLVLIVLFAASVMCIKAPLEEGLVLYLLEGIGAFFLLLVLFHASFVHPHLSRAPFPRLGFWSMGLFVVHTPLFSLLDSSLYVLLADCLPPWAALLLTFSVGMALCIFAAYLLHTVYTMVSSRFRRRAADK